MNIFDLFFGNGSEQNQSDGKETFSYTSRTGTNSDEHIEQLVSESVKDLQTHLPNLTTSALEAEAIYLAAYIYLRGNYDIDFELDYLPEGLVERIPNKDYSVSDKVFHLMIKYGQGLYGSSEADYGKDGYKMNIQLCKDYAAHIKSYFMRAHKIGQAASYHEFVSKYNARYVNGVKTISSPTERLIQYRFSKDGFDIIIPPYNPRVTGHATRKGNVIKCQSSDGNRTFVFHFEEEVKPSKLKKVEMYRNDKGDMITYFKSEADDPSISSSEDIFKDIQEGRSFKLSFTKIMGEHKWAKTGPGGTMYIIEQGCTDNNISEISRGDDGKIHVRLAFRNLFKERMNLEVPEDAVSTAEFQKEDSEYAPECCVATDERAFFTRIEIYRKNGCIFAFLRNPIPNNPKGAHYFVELDDMIND